jgi:hypothetical protein
MPYEVTTPLLLEAADIVRATISDLRAGRLEARDAHHHNMGAQRLINVVGQDVKARLALPRIRVYEEAEAAAAAKAEADKKK